MAETNTRPDATTGQPIPSPNSTDQMTFSNAENRVGRVIVDAEIPLQFGPRNCGQSSADASVAMPHSHPKLIKTILNAISICLGITRTPVND